MMRTYLVAAGVMLLAVGAASSRGVDTGADVQKYCPPLVEGSYRSYDEAQSAGSCEGMVETTMVFASHLPADTRSCPPAQGSIMEGVKTLLRYLDRNPDRASEPAITLAIEAFRDAWPCYGNPDAAGVSESRPKKRVAKKPKETAQ